MVDETTAEVAGRVLVTEINELTGWGLEESDDYETIAGYVLHHTGTVPDTGATLPIGAVDVEIVSANRRQIDRLRLRPREQPAGS
jgi:CBS domain containing-hemolysin-like protein